MSAKPSPISNNAGKLLRAEPEDAIQDTYGDDSFVLPTDGP